MIAALYKSKKALRENIGQPLRYRETSCFGVEYRDNGILYVVGPDEYTRKWFGQVTMADGKIAKVS